MPPPGPFATLRPADGPARSGTKGPSAPLRRSVVSSRPNGLVRPNNQPLPKERSPSTPGRAAAIEAIIAGFEALMRSLADSTRRSSSRSPSRCRRRSCCTSSALSGELHMSELVARLGVSLSTVSGLVDRVVDHGLATRREDPVDRRQVVVGLTDRGHRVHRPLPRAQRAPDARRCSSRSTTTSWPASATPSTALARAADPLRPAAEPRRHPKGSRMSRLSEFAVAKRSVTLLLAGALFIAGIARVGQPPAGAPAGHRAAGHHRHRAAPRRRRGRRRGAGDQADRAGHLGRAPARGAPVHVRQLALAGRRAVLVRHRRQGDRAR